MLLNLFLDIKLMMGPFDVARGTHQLSDKPEHLGAIQQRRKEIHRFCAHPW
jgi:hypothetical protein